MKFALVWLFCTIWKSNGSSPVEEEELLWLLLLASWKNIEAIRGHGFVDLILFFFLKTENISRHDGLSCCLSENPKAYKSFHNLHLK